MWSKLYLALLGLSIVVMAFFTYYSWSWLQSIGLPAAAVAGYEYHAAFSWPTLWLSAALLLLVGNAVLWTTARSWAMWMTFVFFATMVLVRFFWLDRALFHFEQANSLTESRFSIGPFFGVILIALMAVIVFFDQFIVLRLRAKTYPPSVEEEPAVE
jgi:hypothetical protein